MEAGKMLEELKEKEEKLKNELIDLEHTFNLKKQTLEDQLVELEKTFKQKKEQYLKRLGAIEALEAIDSSVPKE